MLFHLFFWKRSTHIDSLKPLEEESIMFDLFYESLQRIKTLFVKAPKNL